MPTEPEKLAYKLALIGWRSMEAHLESGSPKEQLEELVRHNIRTLQALVEEVQ